jgi:hypothetical protein
VAKSVMRVGGPGNQQIAVPEPEPGCIPERMHKMPHREALAAAGFARRASLQLSMLVAVCPSSELIRREGPTSADVALMDRVAGAAAASCGCSMTCLPAGAVTRPRPAPD